MYFLSHFIRIYPQISANYLNNQYKLSVFIRKYP